MHRTIPPPVTALPSPLHPPQEKRSHRPRPPVCRAIHLAFNQVKLRWFASTDSGGSAVHGYQVYRGGNLISGANPITTIEYTDSTVAAVTTYSYTVRAVDNAGNNSSDSTAVNITTPYELLFEDDFNRVNGTGPEWSSQDHTSLSGHRFRCDAANFEDPEEQDIPCVAYKNIASGGNVRITLDGVLDILFWGGYRVSVGYYIQIRNSFGSVIAQTCCNFSASNLTIEASSTTGRIKVYTDGTLRLDYTGSTGLSGYAGLFGYDTGQTVDNFRVYRLP